MPATQRVYEWMVILFIAAAGGIVKHVISPDHRVGLGGFLAAMMVGVFSGFVAATIVLACNGPTEVQWIMCAFGSVTGFAFLRALISWLEGQRQSNNYNIHGNVNQVGGEINNNDRRKDAE